MSESTRRWAAANRGVWLRAAMALIACGALLAGCGFHLRGTEALRLPPELVTLRVQVAESKMAHDPLRLQMEEALRLRAGVTVTQSQAVPVLRLSGESAGSGIVSADPAGQPAERILNYQLTFEIRDAEGRSLTPPQTIRLQHVYGYDPRAVLAKEREERELREALRRDAIEQIVRRLTRVTLTIPAAAGG